MSYYLRKARQGDEKKLAEIESASFSKTLYGNDVLSESKFRKFLKSPSAFLGVAADTQGCLLGYFLLLFRKNGISARLYGVAVHPDFQGRGIGEALMREIETVARQKKCKRIILEVREDNRGAVRKYEKTGYQIYKTLPNYYSDGGQGLKMEKIL